MDFSALPALVPRLLFMLALVMVAGCFAGSETALFSLTRVTRERLSRSASANDRYLVGLLSDPRRLIVTVLVGNELINITFSSMAANVFQTLLPKAGEITLIVATTLVAVPMILVFGEIIPKSIALRTAEMWGKIAARPIGAFAVVATPVRLVLATIAQLVMRAFGGGAAAAAPAAIDEAEFKALVDASSEAGTLEAAERRLIHNVFRFGDRTVAEIMTPARKVFSLSFDLPILRLLSEVARQKLSRVPIYRGRKEEVIGILFAKDLVGASMGRLKGRTVKDLLRTPMYVPKTTKCDRLFREFQRKRTHLALVVDEYGRLVGLVTMDDLLTSLFGPIIREELEKEKERARMAGESTPPPPASPGEEGSS